MVSRAPLHVALAVLELKPRSRFTSRETHNPASVESGSASCENVIDIVCRKTSVRQSHPDRLRLSGLSNGVDAASFKIMAASDTNSGWLEH